MERLRMLLLGMILSSATVLAFSPRAPSLASPLSEQTLFHFEAPVQVPGLVLAPGDYVFRLSLSTGDMNVVKIENPAQDRVYGFFLVAPDYHTRTFSAPCLIFKPGAPGSPEKIEAWFYPGEHYGNRFLYKK